jgi:uncharacterized membrane protein YtjA (UPF0391 family)
MCLVVSVIAGALNLVGMSAGTVRIFRVLFLVWIVLVAIHVIAWAIRSDCMTGSCRDVDSVTA